MTVAQPHPISATERRERLSRVTRIAREFGFVGRVEYRHVFSSTGGAQFGLGSSTARDLLIVYAEAFERDADPEDFSMAAIIAHERGHQVVCRNEALQAFLADRMTLTIEEILASLAGSLVVESEPDREALMLKALDDAIGCGVELPDAIDLISELRSFLENTL
jgi:hypothetical protein